MAKENSRYKRTVKAARNRAEDMVEEGSDQMEDMIDDVKDRASKTWDTTKRQARKGASQIQDYAEDNPWQVAAIAAGVGLLIGALLMRRRD